MELSSCNKPVWSSLAKTPQDAVIQTCGELGTPVDLYGGKENEAEQQLELDQGNSLVGEGRDTD